MSLEDKLIFFPIFFQEYEDEFEEEEEDDKPVSTRFEHALEEEDPEVIRDLITLIKRVGGLDELEKQLQMRLNQNSSTTTTAAPISQSLYNKVLGTKRGTLRPQTIEVTSRAGAEIPLVQRQNKENRYSAVIRNSRPKPQNEGLDKLSEVEGGGVVNERPKYTTITRTQAPKAQGSSVDEEDDDDDHQQYSVTETVNEERTPTTHQPTYQYVNIHRARPSTTTTIDSVQNEDEYEHENIRGESVSTTTPRMQYVNIQRVRPTKPSYYLDEIESESPTPESKCVL